jgi:hypothetical protein
MASKAKSKCLICGRNKPYSRGVCQSCGRDCHELIRLGKTTDAKLVAEGLLLPTKRVGRRVKLSPVLVRLRNKAS